MPMVGKGHGHGIDVLVGEDLPQIGVAFGLVLGASLHRCLCSLERGLIDIAQCGDGGVIGERQVGFDMIRASSAETDDTYLNLIIRAHNAGGLRGCQRHSRGMEEMPSG